MKSSHSNKYENPTGSMIVEVESDDRDFFKVVIEYVIEYINERFVLSPDEFQDLLALMQEVAEAEDLPAKVTQLKEK